jgi:hypothetical protein
MLAPRAEHSGPGKVFEFSQADSVEIMVTVELEPQLFL